MLQKQTGDVMNLFWIWSTGRGFRGLCSVFRVEKSSLNGAVVESCLLLGLVLQVCVPRCVMHLIWLETPWPRRILNRDADHCHFSGPTRAWSRLAGCCARTGSKRRVLAFQNRGAICSKMEPDGRKKRWCGTWDDDCRENKDFPSTTLLRNTLISSFATVHLQHWTRHSMKSAVRSPSSFQRCTCSSQSDFKRWHVFTLQLFLVGG